jgi:hypothetical protein
MRTNTYRKGFRIGYTEITGWKDTANPRSSQLTACADNITGKRGIVDGVHNRRKGIARVRVLQQCGARPAIIGEECDRIPMSDPFPIGSHRCPEERS